MPQTIMASLTVTIYMTSVTVLSFYVPYHQSHRPSRRSFPGRSAIANILDSLLLTPDIESTRRLAPCFIYTSLADWILWEHRDALGDFSGLFFACTKRHSHYYHTANTNNLTGTNLRLRILTHGVRYMSIPRYMSSIIHSPIYLSYGAGVSWSNWTFTSDIAYTDLVVAISSNQKAHGARALSLIVW